MMATPADLEDFAIGFSLNEGLIDRVEEIQSLDIIVADKGVEARIWLKADRGRMVAARRRSRMGPTGCGLCGIESLELSAAKLTHTHHGGGSGHTLLR